MRVLLVTGTGTEIGKTVVTAALAATAADAGRSVAAVKLAQTGVRPGEEGDADAVRRLCGVDDVHELARYPEPLAPDTAARRAGARPRRLADTLSGVRGVGARDLLLLEGAGGLLVRLGADGHTAADVGRALDAEAVVVTPPGLGALNLVALTAAALRARGVPLLGVVIGAWPAEPDLACRTNLSDFPDYAGAPLLGMLPAGAGAVAGPRFRALAAAGLAPELGGRWPGPPVTAGG